MIGGHSKAGKGEKAGNYRWIALGNCVAKVITRVLVGRLSKCSENLILQGQGGFRPGRGCADQVLVLRSVCGMGSQYVDEGLWMMREYGFKKNLSMNAKTCMKEMR